MGFISFEQTLADDVVRGLAERHADRQEIRPPEQLLDADQLDAELGREPGVLVGVMGDEAQAERGREAEHLGADIAHAELAQGLADQALAHVVGPLGPAVRDPAGPSRSLISSFWVSARMKVRIETATGRRTPSGVMHQGDAGFGAGRDVDAVVADAEAGHDGELPSAGTLRW